MGYKLKNRQIILHLGKKSEPDKCLISGDISELKNRPQQIISNNFNC